MVNSESLSKISSEKVRSGLLIASGFVLLLLVVDGLKTAFLIFFPLAFETTRFPVHDLKSITSKVSYQTFEEPFSKRNLFQIAVGKPKAVTAAPTGSVFDQFELAGILRGREDQVILKDRTTRQSFFLKVGTSVGSVQVKEIRAKSVVLATGQEEREFYLEK